MEVLDKDGDNPFEKWNDGEGSKWKSVFGMDDANLNFGYAFDEEETSQGNTTIGHVEFKAFLSELEGPIKSPYRQGHYIYTVIAGGGTGTQSVAPIIFVADLESPASFYKKLQP